MYLRFRNSQLSATRSDNAFEEIYRLIHKRLPKQSRPNNKPFFKVQIYLVRNEWINGKPKQIYIGSVINAKAQIDENKKINLDDEFWEIIRERLNCYGVKQEKQNLLLKKIEVYFSTLQTHLIDKNP